MSKQIFQVTPDENRMEELLTKFQPVPSEQFHQKMKQASWRVDRGARATVKNLRLKFAFAVIAFFLLSALFVTPQGRAWAQEIVQFFRRVSSTTIPLSEKEKEEIFVPYEQFELPLVRVLTPALSPDMAGLPECQSSQDARSYTCQVSYAESKLGFDLEEFPVQPEGWEFESLDFDIVSKTAFIRYRIGPNDNNYNQLLFIQSLDNQSAIFSYLSAAVPADQVEAVKIGSYNGEYVKGLFAPSDDGSKLIWNSSDVQQRLAWSDGTRWYSIELFDNGTKPVERDQLVRLAAGLVDKPLKQVKPLDPDFLYSISDAEKVSGLDLKGATLLPMGVNFSSAQYLSSSHKVLLKYGLNAELVIHEWKGTPTHFDDLATPSNQDYDIVDVNGRNAYYAFSNGPSPYWFLWWSQDELNYQIYYYQNLSAEGGFLTKEKMIAIAESMSDINDVRGDTSKPYEYLAVYEQALGFSAKEFPATPEGWSFTEVSAFPHPGCINLAYTAKKGNGRLFLQQCNADMDQYLAQYDIPRNAIQQVKIGNIQGQYTFGSPDVDETGKTVWNPKLPYRRLEWQQDGLWMQISLGGDSIALYDQDDLISYAESLR